MGKVVVSEPVKGEALTVTKLNNTISSWTTESSNINDENVHDQSLDNYNFADDSVRFVNTIVSRGKDLIRFANKKNENIEKARVFVSETTLDFTNHSHIFRGSYHIYAYPHYSSATSNMYFEITTRLFVSHGSSSPVQVPASKRIIRYEGTQLNRVNLDETIGYSCLLNNVTALSVTGTVSNLQVYLEVTFDHIANIHSGDNVKMGVYGNFSDIETIKR
tara:strand:+ start:1278 stop:1934 length:657 start_codon:yes stop_codon:yes gene_type:complete